MKNKTVKFLSVCFLLVSCSDDGKIPGNETVTPQVEEDFVYYSGLKEIYDNSINNKEITLKSYLFFGHEEIDNKEIKREVTNLKSPDENANIENSFTYFNGDLQNLYNCKSSKAFEDYFNAFIQQTNFHIDDVNNSHGAFQVENASLGTADIYYDGTVGYTKDGIHYLSDDTLDIFYSFLEYIKSASIYSSDKFDNKSGNDFLQLLGMHNASIFCNNKEYQISTIIESMKDDSEVFSDHYTLYINAEIPYSLEGIEIRQPNDSARKTIINKDGYIIEYRNVYRAYYSQLAQNWFEDEYASYLSL